MSKRSRWARRLRTRLDRFFRRPAVDGAVLALVLASVVLLLVEFYGGLEGDALEAVALAGDAVTGIFIVELSLRWFAAPSTRAHWQEFWLDWLAVVPLFRPMRALRALRVLRALRLLRLYRMGVIAHRFAGTFDPRRFGDRLRESLAHYDGPQAEYVQLAPDLFRLLTNLLEDGRVHNEARALVCQALAYFIMPFDVLPEEVHGAEGYLDDVYLCLWVVDRLREELPEHVVEEGWEGEGEVVAVVAEALSEVESIIGAEDAARVRRYVGVGEVAAAAMRAGS